MDSAENKPVPEVPGVELTSAHGLPCVRVTRPEASGLVFLQGAHVAEWVPAGAEPVIWMSEKALYQSGKALRGGVPICFPWFGAHATEKAFPAHGFARTMEFQYLGARLTRDQNAELEFVLQDDSSTQALFPHAFAARLRVTFGATLELAFSVENHGAVPFTFEEALHSYFHVADVRNIGVHGLGGAPFLDKVRGMAEFTQTEDELSFSGETDRVYRSAATCVIRDPGRARRVRIEKTHSEATVVWNPWAERAAQMADFGADAWPGMVCVESANVGATRIQLAPMATHTLTVRVALEPLG